MELRCILLHSCHPAPFHHSAPLCYFALLHSMLPPHMFTIEHGSFIVSPFLTSPSVSMPPTYDPLGVVPALCLHPINNSFASEHVTLLLQQHIKIGFNSMFVN